MSLTENGASGFTMPVQPMGGYGNGFGGLGSDSFTFLIILFLFAFMGNGWNGFGGFGGGGNNGTTYVANDIQRGFDQATLTNGINGISSAICNGFSNVQQSLCTGFAGVEQGANARQLANMQQSFANQTAMMQGFNALGSQFADCCCENRLANCQTQNIIQNEGNATRIADANNARDLLTAFNSGIQSLKDQIYADRLDDERRENANLRQELMFARGQASQIDQNAAIINGVYNRLNECPVGTVPVYGEQPIFSCNRNLAGNFGCGCSAV